MPLLVADVRRSLGGLIRAEVKAAAGADKVLQASERATLSPLVQNALPANDVTVNDAVDLAMARAMGLWAQHNQASGTGAPLLSKKELKAIGKTEAGPLTGRAAEIVLRRLQPVAAPVVALVNPPAGLSIEKAGDVYILKATAAVPNGPITLSIDGKEMSIDRYPNSFGIYNSLAPEGFGIEQVDIGPQQSPTITEGKLRITRDPPGSLTTDQAAAKAKDALIAYLKDERIHDTDWQDYFPKTWAEVEADGVVAQIEAMVAKRDPESLGRRPDIYLFVGRGPYDLYTEVTIRKSDGKVINPMVEID